MQAWSQSFLLISWRTASPILSSLSCWRTASKKETTAATAAGSLQQPLCSVTHTASHGCGRAPACHTAKMQPPAHPCSLACCLSGSASCWLVMRWVRRVERPGRTVPSAVEDTDTTQECLQQYRSRASCWLQSRRCCGRLDACASAIAARYNTLRLRRTDLGAGLQDEACFC